ncbi:Lipid/polyisoprenoid-binding YceI-like domain-containing protein [Gammaproteobacteria bacterium]
MKMPSLAWLMMVGGISSAQAVEYTQLHANQSNLTFAPRLMGVPVEGRFNRFSSQLTFDPQLPDHAKISLVVDLASIDAGSQEANDEVIGQTWLNIKTFPTATFVSDQVKTLGANRFEVTGKLAIKGKTHTVSVPFTYKTEEKRGVFDGEFVLKRADFAIGEGQWADFETIANEIQIHFHVVATPQ